MQYEIFADHIKKMREASNVSQEDIAEWLDISQATVSRWERGEVLPKYSQYVTLMQKLGEASDEYFALLLDGDELFGYEKLTALRHAIRDGKTDEARQIIAEVTGKEPFDHGTYLQFLKYAEVMTDTDTCASNAIEKLTDAINVTIKDFDISRIADYRLCYNEIAIIGEFATRYEMLGERELSIDILIAVKENMDKNYRNEKEKAGIYPTLLANLANSLGRAGRHDEVIEICGAAKRMAIKYNQMSVLPYLLSIWANAEKAKGNLRGGQELIQNAYYSARAMEDYFYAEIIKKDAKKTFGISIKYKITE